MFCPHCGNELTDDAIVCASCSKQVIPLQKIVSGDSTGQWGKGIFVLLILLAIYLPPGGLVAGIVGLRSKPKRRQGIKLLVISVCVMALYVWIGSLI